MICHREKNSLVRMVAGGRALTIAALICGVSGVIAAPDARAGEPAIARSGWADGWGGDNHAGRVHVAEKVGNGKFNKSYTTVLGPTINRGLQQVANVNVSGGTNTQISTCRKKHLICKIGQRQFSSGNAVDIARKGDRGGVHAAKVKGRPH